MPGENLSDLQQALAARGIKTMRSAPVTLGFASISMSTYSAQEFLTALAPGPIDEDDRLAMRILGRGQDLGPGDEPWQFEAVPTIRDTESGLEVHIIVNLPDSDVPEVVSRLRGKAPPSDSL